MALRLTSAVTIPCSPGGNGKAKFCAALSHNPNTVHAYEERKFVSECQTVQPGYGLFINSLMALRKVKPRLQDLRGNNAWYPFTFKSHERGRERWTVLSALPETAVSVVVAAIAVGASATLLRRMTEASGHSDSSMEMCKDCGGSGICTECNGEGFILKQLSEEKAEKARMTAKNMATRYTAGLPKKWSYCYKCSSTRSCRTCGGSGQIPT